MATMFRSIVYEGTDEDIDNALMKRYVQHDNGPLSFGGVTVREIFLGVQYDNKPEDSICILKIKDE